MAYDQLAPQASIERVVAAVQGRGITPHFVPTKAQALAKIQSLIPEKSSVMTGSSTTLNQIGFTDLLKSGGHPWHNLKEAIVNEPDPEKQSALRQHSVLADYFLGSVHAVTEEGIALIASATGSQLPAYAFTSKNVIWAVGAQKIVSTLEAGFQRVREYTFPLEDARMKSTGAAGSTFGKWLIFEKETMGRDIHLILINEVLGF